MKIFGIPCYNGTKENILKHISSGTEKMLIISGNPEKMLIASKDPKDTENMKKSDYIISDGMGMYVGYQIEKNKKAPLIELLLVPLYIMRFYFARKQLYQDFGPRIRGNDFTKDVLALATKEHKKVGVIDLYNPGDKKKVAVQKKFVQEIHKNYPKLDISHYIWKKGQEETIIQELKEKNIPIVFSTLGMKAQEENIVFLMKKLPSIKVGLATGASFDYITGMQKAAPDLWSILGFEWFYRLLTGPQKIKRLRRIYNALFGFVTAVIFYKEQ